MIVKITKFYKNMTQRHKQFIDSSLRFDGRSSVDQWSNQHWNVRELSLVHLWTARDGARHRHVPGQYNITAETLHCLEVWPAGGRILQLSSRLQFHVRNHSLNSIAFLIKYRV